jgi:hypothetical protein
VTETFSPPSSRSNRPRHSPNKATMIGGLARVRVRWDALVETHERACQAMAGAPPKAPGFRVYWARTNGMGWTDLAAPGEYAILGRHSECDGLLGNEPTLPLRHLLATTVPLADGLALRLLDLQTGTPFYLDDGTPRRSLVVSGSVAISVGEQTVGAVPIEETDGVPKLALGPLYRPKVTDARSSQSMMAAPVPTQEQPYRSAAPVPAPGLGPGRLTLVTSMPPPRSFADLAPFRASQVLELGEDRSWPPAAVARIVVQRGTLMAQVDLSAEQLEHGVILGRADRCLDQGLMAVLNNATSRAHVLLLRNPQEHDVLDVFDLCSTNGTYVRGQRVRRIRIESDGATFAMGLHDAAVTVKVRFPPSHRH